MLVSGAQVRYSPGVSRQLYFFKLRDGDLEGFADSSHASVSRALLRSGDLFQEIASERIVRPAYRAVGFTNQLRNQVQVPDRSEESHQVAEWQIHVDLLQVGLRKSLVVGSILFVGTLYNGLFSAHYALTTHMGTPLTVLPEGKLVGPRIPLFRFQFDTDRDVRRAASGQTAERTHSPASAHRIPEPAAEGSEIT